MLKTLSFTTALLAIFLSSCNHPLLITPEIPTGGLNSKSPEENPAYSGDGRYLAFASERKGHRDVYLYDLEQRRLVSLPNLNRRDSSQDQPALNNDGRYLVYVSTERGKPDIMVYDRTKQRATLLTANVRGSVKQPTITGDGSQVAFQTSQLGEWNIAIVQYNAVNP
ncbi:MAG: biopolymer transporter [Crocosphaera sp.]|nr:biopolymer transporter [Crocosphaera sp.]